MTTKINTLHFLDLDLDSHLGGYTCSLGFTTLREEGDIQSDFLNGIYRRIFQMKNVELLEAIELEDSDGELINCLMESQIECIKNAILRKCEQLNEEQELDGLIQDSDSYEDETLDKSEQQLREEYQNALRYFNLPQMSADELIFELSNMQRIFYPQVKYLTDFVQRWEAMLDNKYQRSMR